MCTRDETKGGDGGVSVLIGGFQSRELRNALLFRGVLFDTPGRPAGILPLPLKQKQADGEPTQPVFSLVSGN